MYANPFQREFNRLGARLEMGRKDLPVLQAADIVAFEGWKQWARIYGDEKRPTRRSFSILHESIPAEWATLRPIALTELLRQNGVGPVAESLLSEDGPT